ncbi:MAG: HEAT repeat domain-containing protein [Phycisphaerales bacterium]|nr:HEAT repeat domain-containing protein [Phycisphaerales bacterium]
MLTSSAYAQMGDNEGESQPDLPSHIINMESPVLSTQEAIRSFQLQDGFEIQLVASEPMIEDPVACTFAPDGSLWVIEMQSFMPDVDGNNEDMPISRVVRLVDVDGDGVMDESSVFLDNLVLPRAIAFAHDGVLLVAPPDLLYCKDTDGDGECDDIKKVASGFGGLDSIEHAGNGMLYGLDNVFHNSQHEFSFKFDGETATAIPVPNHGQWGITHDDYGRNYYTPNSYPILVDELPKHYTMQSGKKVGLHGIYRGIVSDKRVYPIRPTPGINRGYQQGRLDKDFKMKVFDAACGPLVYRDTVYGEDFESSVFVCDTVGNLVSRYNIIENEHHSLKAVPAYNQSEFIASTDERFRPVNLTLGPDGAVYIVDMYRGIVQHRIFVTSFLRKQIKARGLEAPLGLGRIWRVVPKDKALHANEDLIPQTSTELVQSLTHSNGSVRDQAQRLLVERKDASVQSALEELVKNAELPRDRIKALWTLDGMGLLSSNIVIEATNDEDSMVRAHALRTAEPFRNDSDIIARFNALSRDENSYVRRQAALSSFAFNGPAGIDFLLELATRDRSDAVNSAVFASLSNREQEALDRVSINKALKEESQENRKLLRQLITTLLNERKPNTRSLIVEFMTKQLTRVPWQSKVALDSLVAHVDKTKSQLKLKREPPRWRDFFVNIEVEDKMKAVALNKEIWWPKRTDVDEVVRSAVSNEMQNLRNRGKRVYNICKTCHQVDGLGQPPTYPPLTGSSYVIGNPDTLVKILLHGMTGPVEVDGVQYEDHMPPAPVKNDYDIAAVATYVRQAWGNNADGVTPSDVSRIRKAFEGRKTPWTVESLID